MEFYRTKQSLEAVGQAENTTINDALKIFYCLCQDIKEAGGKTADRQPLGDDKEALRKLCWAGNTLLMMFKNNREQIVDPDRGQMVRDIQKKLTESQEMWEEAERQAEELEKGKAELADRYERIGRLRKEAEAIGQKTRKTRQMIGELEEKIRNVNVAALSAELADRQETWKDLEEKRKLLEEGIGRAKKNAARELEQVEKLEQERKEIDAAREERRAKKKETEDKIGQCREEMDRLEQWFKGMEAGQWEAEYKRLRRRVETLREAKKTLLDDMEELNVLEGGGPWREIGDCGRYFEEKLNVVESKMAECEESYRMVIALAEEGSDGV